MRVRIGEDGDIKEPDYGVHIRVSGEYEVVHDRYLPIWLELTIDGRDGPNLFRRIEVRDGRPELVAMSWWARPGQREIKQKDVRNLPVASILERSIPRSLSTSITPTSSPYPPRETRLRSTQRGDSSTTCAPALRTAPSLPNCSRAWPRSTAAISTALPPRRLRAASASSRAWRRRTSTGRVARDTFHRPNRERRRHEHATAAATSDQTARG